MRARRHKINMAAARLAFENGVVLYRGMAEKDARLVASEIKLTWDQLEAGGYFSSRLDKKGKPIFCIAAEDHEKLFDLLMPGWRKYGTEVSRRLYAMLA